MIYLLYKHPHYYAKNAYLNLNVKYLKSDPVLLKYKQ